MSWSISLAGPAGSAEGAPGSLISFRRCMVWPGRDGSPLELGGLSVPGDNRGSDRPYPRWAGCCGWTGGAEAAAAAPHRASTKADGQRLDTAPVPGSPPRGKRLHPRPARPRAWPSAGAPRRMRAGRTAMTPVLLLSAVAAATCPGCRNAHLPGTIREPLQITVMRDWSAVAAQMNWYGRHQL